MIKIYTDGSWDSKTKYGGWGFYLYIGNKCKEGSGYSPKTTSIKMELVAIYEALLALETLPKEYTDKPILIHTDSMYCVNSLTGEAGTANIQMITRCKELIDKYNCEIKHVKGHSGDMYNEYVDRLAVMARYRGKKELRKAIVTTYEDAEY